MDMLKSEVKGYTRKDGVYVPPHHRKGDPAAPKAKVFHPRSSENGNKVPVFNPTHPSAPSTWHSPKSIATFVPNGDVPMSLNGIAIAKWRDAPQTTDGWNYVDGINDAIHEPDLVVPKGKRASSGCVIQEPDGRTWVVHPTNEFGGYAATFPKGSAEPELSLQANAIKECFEETGLKVEIIKMLGDYQRTTSVARMYLARRVGGDPSACGWESQAVSLCPADRLYDLLNMQSDHPIAEKHGAGPAPKPANKPEKQNSADKSIEL